MPRRRLRPLIWIALLAMWATALLPTVSHALALAHGDAGRWAELCTPQGMRRVVVADAAGAEPVSLPSAAGHLEHCPFCALSAGAGAAAPPPAPPAVLALPGAGAEPPALAMHAPDTPHAWRTAQPRGPPPAC